MKQILVAIVFLTSSSLVLGQNKEETLSDIQNKYQVLKELMDSNALRQYHTAYTYNASTKKSPLTFYYNGNELKYILHIYTWGHITYRDEFYVWDGKLFLQHTTNTIRYKDYRKKRFSKSLLEHITLTLEDRFYFKDRMLIQCEFKNFQNSGSAITKTQTSQIRNTSTECDQANNVLAKFDLLKKYQQREVKNAVDLPKSISKIYDPEFNQTVYQQNN